MLGAKSGIDAEQVAESAKEESCTYEQNQGKSDFRNHKAIAKTSTAPTNGTLAPGAQSAAEVGACTLKSG
jgi:hypothetical protein